MMRMKKAFLTLLAAVGLMLSGVSCTGFLYSDQNDGPQVPVEDNGLITISATLEQPDTKSSLDVVNNSVLWDDNDEILVIDKTTGYSSVFTFIPESEGDFTGTAPSGNGPYYAIYPATLDVSVSGDDLTVTLPSAQVYAANSFGNGANYAVAVADDLEEIFEFKNLCGAIRLSLTGDKTISSINLYCNDSQLNGTAAVTFDGDDPLLTFVPGQTDESYHKVTLGCGDGQGLSSTQKDFYVILPAGSMSSFCLEVIDTDGNAMLRHGSGQIERSSIRPMGALGYSPQYKSSFLLSDKLAAAVYSNTLADDSSIGEPGYYYTEANGQYSFNTTESSRMLRIQNWTAGYALTLTAPGNLAAGQTVQIGTEKLGAVTGIESSYSDMKVVKNTGKRAWLVNQTSGVGFIFLLED